MSSVITQLPKTTDGDVDWRTLGNMLSAHILGEVLCASYVDYKYGQRTKDFKADTDWQFYYEEKGVVALKKVLRDSPLNVFMGRCVIDRPMNEVISFLENHERRKEWDRYLSVQLRQCMILAEIKILKTISSTDFIYYMVLEAKHCLVKLKRDMVIFAHNANIGEKHVRTTMSVNLQEYPPHPGITRANVFPGTGFVCEPYEDRKDRTLLSWCAHCDLRNMPPVIVNQGMKRQPMAVYRIREILSDDDSESQDYQSVASVDKDQFQHEHLGTCLSSEPQSDGRQLAFLAQREAIGYEDELPVENFLTRDTEIVKDGRVMNA